AIRLTPARPTPRPSRTTIRRPMIRDRHRAPSRPIRWRRPSACRRPRRCRQLVLPAAMPSMAARSNRSWPRRLVTATHPPRWTQAEGLWYPRVSVEGSAGVRKLHNPTRESLGIAGQTLQPVEGFVIADQLLWNSGGRTAEIKRQASRTDAAASRIEERSEFVA